MLRQNEQHEQIQIMANNGPLCKGIENDKGNILESELWGKTLNVKWCVSIVPQCKYISRAERQAGSYIIKLMSMPFEIFNVFVQLWYFLRNMSYCTLFTFI